MRTHRFAFYATVLVGIATAIALSMVTGEWLDLHRPLGREGLVRFLGATTLIVLGTGVLAARLGDWIDERIHTRRHLPS